MPKQSLSTLTKIYSLIIPALLFNVLPLAVILYTHGRDASAAFSIIGLLLIIAAIYFALAKADYLWPHQSDRRKT